MILKINMMFQINFMTIFVTVKWALFAWASSFLSRMQIAPNIETVPKTETSFSYMLTPSWWFRTKNMIQLYSRIPDYLQNQVSNSYLSLIFWKVKSSICSLSWKNIKTPYQNSPKISKIQLKLRVKHLVLFFFEF